MRLTLGFIRIRHGSHFPGTRLGESTPDHKDPRYELQHGRYTILFA